MSLPIFFQGEARLIRWGETANAGRTVTLEIEEVGERHPFKGLRYGAANGQRFQVVMVAIGDDETPEPQPAKAEGPRQAPESTLPVKTARKFSELSLAQQAALKLQDQDFIDWMKSLYPAETHYGTPDEGLKRILNIMSKTDLDRWPEAGDNWRKLLTSFDMRGYRAP